MNFSKWDSGGKIIFISTCLAFISFFFKWVDIGFISQTGFGQDTYWFIVLFIYPLVRVMQEKSLSKAAGYICALIGVIVGIAYISWKSVDFLGTTINAASTGVYVYIAACVLLAFGIFKYRKN